MSPIKEKPEVTKEELDKLQEDLERI